MKLANIVEFKGVFDKKLKRFLDGKLAESKKIINDKFILSLVEHGAAVALSGGKRFRPYICSLMYQTAGGKKQDNVLPLMLGLELVHTFALIHDDIIDQGKGHHGVLAVHEYARKLLNKQKRVGDTERLAQSQAILTGDILLSWAAGLFMEVPESQEQFQSLMNEVLLGQMMDADFVSRTSVTEKQIYQRIVLKSARYSFVQPMLFGRLAAGRNAGLDKFSEQFGASLGVAFQIQDDILDIAGDAKKMQKPVLNDLTERQHTFLTQYIFDRGSAQEKRQLKELFGQKLRVTDQPRVVQLFESAGALDHAHKLADKYFLKAETILQQTTMSEQYRQHWWELVGMVRGRTS